MLRELQSVDWSVGEQRTAVLGALSREIRTLFCIHEAKRACDFFEAAQKAHTFSPQYRPLRDALYRPVPPIEEPRTHRLYVPKYATFWQLAHNVVEVVSMLRSGDGMQAECHVRYASWCVTSAAHILSNTNKNYLGCEWALQKIRLGIFLLEQPV